MTLATRVRILDPVPIEGVWQTCQTLIGAPASVVTVDETGVRSNDPGQGLPAWLWLYYGVERPMHDDADDAPHATAPNPYMAEIVFDTAYGYQADNGAGCDDLHAWLVTQLGEWLTERGRRWAWKYEYEGTWHDESALTMLGDAKRGAL